MPQLPHTLPHWLLVAASAATVAFFAGGLTLYFERAPRPPWVLALHYFSLLLAGMQVVGMLIYPPRADAWAGIAIGMFAGAILLFLSAIETAQRARVRLQRSFVDLPLPDRLLTDGPYRWVRHPFCTGYFLAALAGPVGIDHPIMIAIAVPSIFVTIFAAVRDEKVWMSSMRAAEYGDYRRRTGMFIPFVGRG